MLTDLFGDFDFDDLNLNEVQQNISQFYVADNHSDAWFFSVNKGYSERLLRILIMQVKFPRRTLEVEAKHSVGLFSRIIVCLSVTTEEEESKSLFVGGCSWWTSRNWSYLHLSYVTVFSLVSFLINISLPFHSKSYFLIFKKNSLHCFYIQHYNFYRLCPDIDETDDGRACYRLIQSWEEGNDINFQAVLKSGPLRLMDNEVLNNYGERMPTLIYMYLRLMKNIHASFLEVPHNTEEMDEDDLK
uniref:Pecanex-like protein n=1 Tax=Heterorhabditis bacteriophora TaxID=37862 RepID=A0A1I7X1M2_HETBA